MDLATVNQDQLEKRRLTQAEIEQQIECFKKGTQYVKLLRAATVGDGIFRLDDKLKADAVKAFDKAQGKVLIQKFVPASGAATRMFKRIFQWIADPEGNRKEINAFFKRVEEFAFFEAWVKAVDKADVETFQSGLQSKVRWLETLVGPEGLDLAAKPKGILSFHKYDTPATPVQEHLSEALAYASSDGQARVHFTVSEEHLGAFEKAVAKALQALGVQEDQVSVTYSHQKPSTDTIAVDDASRPIEMNGELVLRPGGHGALIHNLNDLDADVVYIKNIDNVAHKRLYEETVQSKKLLGGILLQIKEDFLGLHTQVSKGLVDQVSIDQCRDKWGLRIPRDYQKLKDYLGRPIRVCGMVKNEGEPGGGPFWCIDKHTGESLQIVEQSQVESDNFRQGSILRSATHFNPVDLVCSLKDLEGNKIDLLSFIDGDQYFITEKSMDGKTIKALEWPGLWNGAMSHWVTVFVEVPISTFNPVKEIADLLRPTHMGEPS